MLDGLVDVMKVAIATDTVVEEASTLANACSTCRFPILIAAPLLAATESAESSMPRT